MKIIAISQRGKKRDFVDLYWCAMNQEPLKHIIQTAVHQYPGQEHNINHILRSLIFLMMRKRSNAKAVFKANWHGIKNIFKLKSESSARNS